MLIALSERGPVIIDEDKWPVISSQRVEQCECAMYIRHEREGARVIVYGFVGDQSIGGYIISYINELVNSIEALCEKLPIADASRTAFAINLLAGLPPETL